MNAPFKSPYPWFGGKSDAAPKIWSALGAVKNYVEPFFGSGAVLLAAGRDDSRLETINDADGFVANFWRALQDDPDAVAYWADQPVNEVDLHARHGWLINRRDRLLWSLEDPEFYDAKIAGWWAWGVSCWIGAGFCSGAGPWVSDGAHILDGRESPRCSGSGHGINRKLLHLGGSGHGINRKLLHLGGSGHGINRKLLHLGDSGKGINRQLPVYEYLGDLAKRIRKVRVCCGDWSRIMGPSVTIKNGLTGVVLDPPYSAETGRCMVYATDCGKVAHVVAKWCIENGDNPMLRIVLCGYEGEHDMPDSWRKIQGRATGGAKGGYGAQRKTGTNENGARERIWFSPACLAPEDFHDLLRVNEGID